MVSLLLLTYLVMHRVGVAKTDSFPSLITANATLAIVLDQDYLGENYEAVKTEVENFLIYGKREILKHGGLNHVFFSWTAINIKREFMAIFSLASCADTWKLFRSAEIQNVLHMAISEPDCPRLPPDKAITIPLVTKGQEVSQLLLDLRTESIFKWKSVVILYDNTLSPDMTTQVIRSLSQTTIYKENAIGVSLVKLPRTTTKTNIKSILSSINPKSVGKNFLAIVSYGLAAVIMEYAKKQELVDINSQWLYVISDTDDRYHEMGIFDKLLSIGDNIAFVYNITSNNQSCMGGRTCHIENLLTGFFGALEGSIKEEFEIAAQVSDEEWEAIRPTKLERRSFLLLSIKKYLKNVASCDNCTYWKIQTSESWGVEYENNDKDAQPFFIPVGIWRPVDGPFMNDELFIHVSHGFRRKTLPLVSFHNPPWQILKVNNSGEVTEYSGLVFDIMKQLAKTLNFTIKVESIDKQKIEVNRTKLINSSIESVLTNNIPGIIIEQVKNRSVAFGACAITVTSSLKQEINFTIPISTQVYTLLVARPKELSRALLFISPFTGDTWLSLAAAIVTIGPILYCINRYSPVYEYEGIPKKGGVSSVQNCIWYIYGALLQQGGMHLPYADSARIIVGSWWLVVLVLATTYCGNLVAFLTFPKIDVPIVTIDDLIKHRETVSWSIRNGNYLESELKQSREPQYKILYERQYKYNNRDLGVMNKISQGKHVLIDWKMSLLYIMKSHFQETGRCDYILGHEEFCDEQLALITAHSTPYLTKINEQIKWLHQVGLIEKWLRDYLPRKDRCWKNKHIVEVNNHTVNLDDMQGSFFVLFLGFVFALMLLVFEKIWKGHFAKKSQKIIHPFVS